MSVIMCHPAFYFHYSVDNNREYLFEVVTSTRTFLFQVIILDDLKLILRNNWKANIIP